MRVAVVCILALVVCCGIASRSHSAAISWVSGTDGIWHTATNWSSNPALPGPTDDVTINQRGTITVSLTATTGLINSLNMVENLFSNTPSDLVVGAGGGTFSGTVTLQAGKITSQTGTLQLQNTVNNDLSGLRASAGGKILFSPGVLPTINGRSNLQTRLEADGANSLLDLSGVSTFTGGGFSNSAILATNGGTVEMENVAAISDGATFIEASGTNSKVDLTAMTIFSRTIVPDAAELRDGWRHSRHSQSRNAWPRERAGERRQHLCLISTASPTLILRAFGRSMARLSHRWLSPVTTPGRMGRLFSRRVSIVRSI